jgi:hypothetical protein
VSEKPKDKMFLIVMGAVTAFGLPFALAFPRSLLEKALALAALLVVAAAIAATVQSFRRDQEPK